MADVTRPVLVLEGIGGSGRSEILRNARERWARKAPLAEVDPLYVADEAAGSMRDVLLATILGLTHGVPGYNVSVDRVVLAHIAMGEPIAESDPEARRAAMVQRINTYRDIAHVENLLADLAENAAQFVLSPGVRNIARTIAREIVRRLKRGGVLPRLIWKDALAWFGHQDQGFARDPVDALIALSVQAHNDNVAVRQDVDHLLMMALLADLRDSVSPVANRPCNAVLLLDNGDAQAAVEFVSALITARGELAHQQMPPDPLTVITTSGGALVTALTGEGDRPPVLTEGALRGMTAGDLRRRGSWIPVLVGDLSVDDVQQMARTRTFSVTLGTRDVARAVHRLTGGHTVASRLVLDKLEDAPDLVDDLGSVLRLPAPQPGNTLERDLLDRVITGLTPQRRADPDLRDDLITLAAARDDAEARLLMPLLADPVEAEAALFTSRTLWSAEGARGNPALAPFVRYLLLRSLAARPAGHGAAWAEVFARLRRHAKADGDLGGRLHHSLALGDDVADELDQLLTTTPADEWLALLDEVVAVPRLGAGPATAGEAPARGEERRVWVGELVTRLNALADLRVSARGELRSHYVVISEAYRSLAAKDPLPFGNRSRQYRKLADELG